MAQNQHHLEHHRYQDLIHHLCPQNKLESKGKCIIVRIVAPHYLQIDIETIVNQVWYLFDQYLSH